MIVWTAIAIDTSRIIVDASNKNFVLIFLLTVYCFIVYKSLLLLKLYKDNLLR